MHDPTTTDADRIQGMLDMKCEQADLQEVVKEMDDSEATQKKLNLAHTTCPSYPVVLGQYPRWPSTQVVSSSPVSKPIQHWSSLPSPSRASCECMVPSHITLFHLQASSSSPLSGSPPKYHPVTSFTSEPMQEHERYFCFAKHLSIQCISSPLSPLSCCERPLS